jgi:hypothetical protein
MSFPLLFACIVGLYFSGMMFFAWAQGLKLHETLEQAPTIFDEDLYFWWFWSFLLYIVYPIGIAIYFTVKGVVILLQAAKNTDTDDEVLY